MLAAKHVPGNMPALTQTKPITTAEIAKKRECEAMKASERLSHGCFVLRDDG